MRKKAPVYTTSASFFSFFPSSSSNKRKEERKQQYTSWSFWVSETQYYDERKIEGKGMEKRWKREN